MYLRNIEPGVRGVNTLSGTVYLGPGEGREVELAPAEEAFARASGWFAFGAGAPTLRLNARKARAPKP